jgi:hypothetical protein
MQLFISIAVLFFLFDLNSLALLNSSDLPDEKIVIARVGSREISLTDFIERAEYTIRPAYCKGSFNNDKNIILSTLIAEKILSLEASEDNELLKNEKFINFILGRKEQKMRELLYFYEGRDKVILDSSEVKKVFSVAGRTYKIQYFNVNDRVLAASLTEKFVQSDSAFEKIFSILNKDGELDSIPGREISWTSPEILAIHKALFSEKLKKDQVIAPLNIDDTTNLFIKIKSWNDRVVISENDIINRYNEVVEKLTNEKADGIYDDFVLRVMENIKVDFDVDVFNEITKILAPQFLNQKEKTENEFLSSVYKNNLEMPLGLVDDFDKIKELPLLSINGKTWNISDLKREMGKHPLVFRKRNSNDKFADQLRLAIVDLIRDKYLTEEAYKRGFDKDEIVTHYEQTWLDASAALLERDSYLKKNIADGKDSVNVIEEYLNPYIKELLKKYSNKIEINVEEYDKIKLTRIDMFTTQADVPYPIYVPAFPQLTTYNRLDYGRKME